MGHARTLRSDTGFTIVELLVVVVISGMIVAALAAVLVQGFSLTPQSQSRTEFAGDVSGLTDIVSDDVANANRWVLPAIVVPATGDIRCDSATGETAIVHTPGALLLYGRSIGPPDADGWRTVAVFRRDLATAEVDDLLVGYCTGSAKVFDLQYQAPKRFTMTLRLAPSPDLEVREIVVTALRRTDD